MSPRQFQPRWRKKNPLSKHLHWSLKRPKSRRQQSMNLHPWSRKLLQWQSLNPLSLNQSL